MTAPLSGVPRTSFRLPFGIGFPEGLKADQYDSENIVVGRTSLTASPSAVFLGKLAEFEQMRRNVWLDTVGAHAVYVVGKRRSGKSYTLGAICEGLVSRSWLRIGEPEQAVLLLDTLNIYGTLHIPALESASDGERRQWQLPADSLQVRYVVPEVSRNAIAADALPLAVDPLWLTIEDWCGLFDVDPFADPLGHLLGIVVEATRSQWAAGAPKQRQNASGIEDLLRVLDTNADALQFEDSTREALRRRLNAVDRMGFLRRPSPAIDSLLTAGTITVVQLRDLDDQVRSLVVAVIVREVMRARSRADAAARAAQARAAQSKPTEAQAAGQPMMPRCWVVIDEAHNYLPTGRSLPSRPVLRRLITEGRNIGLSVVVATQQPSGLDSSIQRNADTLIVHSMSMRDDIAAAEGMVNTMIPDSANWGPSEKASGRVFERIVRALPQGNCLISTDTASRVFGVRMRPRITLHGGESY